MEGKVLFRSLTATVFLILFAFATGCISWEPGWTMIEKPSMKGDVKALLAKANAQISRADTREKMGDIITTYEAIIKIDPMNYEALWGLGRYYHHMAIAYSRDKAEKEQLTRKGIEFCEMAMYCNDSFRKEIDRGRTVFEAYTHLSKNEFNALYYWYINLGVLYKDCNNILAQAINYRLASKFKPILQFMVELDPLSGGGHAYWALALYYIRLPKLMGGDLVKGDELFRKCIEIGPRWIDKRWGRAKYLYTKTGNREAFKKDLEWVVAQDPHRADSPYPANVIFQRDAREMLEHIDDYF